MAMRSKKEAACLLGPGTRNEGRGRKLAVEPTRQKRSRWSGADMFQLGEQRRRRRRFAMTALSNNTVRYTVRCGVVCGHVRPRRQRCVGDSKGRPGRGLGVRAIPARWWSEPGRVEYVKYAARSRGPETLQWRSTGSGSNGGEINGSKNGSTQAGGGIEGPGKMTSGERTRSACLCRRRKQAGECPDLRAVPRRR